MSILVAKKLDNFFSKYPKHTYNKSELLIRAETDPGGVFFLKEGVIRMYSISLEGENIALNIFRPISFFPLAWAVNNSRNPYFYEATTPVVIHKAPKQDMVKFLKNEPEVLYDLLQRIYRGLEGHFMRMEYLMGGSVRKKLIIELIIYAKRFGVAENDATKIDFKFTQNDIASDLGIARETVSREMQKLKKERCISIKNGRIYVTNLKKLEEELHTI